MKKKSLITSAAMAAFVQSSSAELLTYWNFNNVDPAYSPAILGSFSTSAAAYGEAYSQSSNSASGVLGSNTANSTVFTGTIDFANIDTVDPTPTINGKTPSAYTNQNGTNGVAGFGVFADSTVNRVGTDSTTGGSLLLLNTGGDLNGHYITFTLSSAGYNSLSLSYAARVTNGINGSQDWEYSLDGNTYLGLEEKSQTPGSSTFLTQTLDLSSISGGAIDNQSTFYLRMTYEGGADQGSTALDNIQFTGSVVPEPSVYALLAGSLALGAVMIRRRR